MQKNTSKTLPLNLSIEDMVAASHGAFKQVNEAYSALPDAAEQPAPQQLFDALEQFFAIARTLETHHGNVQLTSMPDLADHGLRLMADLYTWAERLQRESARNAFEQLTIALALWAAQHHLPITDLEPVVNALSHIANQLRELEQLAQLSDFMDDIIDTAAPTIKQDNDRSDPGRPWRVLNLNHGIIATRSHDPQRMEAVFEQLMFRLPEDAPGFFDEGMQQMSKIDYPPHVRLVMEKYYRKTHQPTLH